MKAILWLYFVSLQKHILLSALWPGTPENGNIASHALLKGKTGAEVPFYNCIATNFMVYVDRLEANLLQLLAHQENSECFSIYSVFIFEVTIADEQTQT